MAAALASPELGTPAVTFADAGARSAFRAKVDARTHGIVTYGLTPPKVTTDTEKLREIAATHAARLKAMALDAVVIYDIHDEEERTKTLAPRPFPFVDTIDGVQFQTLMGDVGAPVVHYRCVAKHSAEQLGGFLRSGAAEASVFVGGAASHQQLDLTLDQAYELRAAHSPGLLLGAVAIPERHEKKGDEHLRMVKKQLGGSTFFITQCVYNAEQAKNMLSEYYYQCKRDGLPMVPVLVTLTPCGSAKTLEFLSWLGVRVSKWLENDLKFSTRPGGILEESFQALVEMFREIVRFAAAKGIPIGCNVESVAIRKAEIDASIRLVEVATQILRDEFVVPAQMSPVTVGAAGTINFVAPTARAA